MAVDTEKAIRNQVLYSIYVRNYSEAGTFAAVQADLDRIKALGTDIICSHPRTDVEIVFLLEVGQFVVLKPKQSKAHCNSER